MNTYYCIWLPITFCSLFFVHAAYACDPDACMMSGHIQDTLIIGEVVKATETAHDVKVIFVFPQNHVTSLKEDDRITVMDLEKAMNLVRSHSTSISVGGTYLMSLNTTGDHYVPAWNIFALKGTTYADAEILPTASPSTDAIMQIFINSGGIETEFYGVGEQIFWRSRDGKIDTQIYPVIKEARASADVRVLNAKNLFFLGAMIVVVMVVFAYGSRKRG